jgi:CubicO group peptidase (beta-lactamase class C family)
LARRFAVVPLFTGLLSLGVALMAHAQISNALAHDLTAADVTAYFDGLMPTALTRADIAGGVVAVVKDGEILLSKGYGLSDVAKHTPFEGATTLVRPGSIAKLFTWTAIMQLFEQGKIDLDRDINAYLDFHIPTFEGKPVTMRHLMTHTAGFEDHLRDFFCKDPKDLQPMGVALRRALPAQLWAPGEIVAYSNYGAGLAGYILQRVSGVPLADYIDEHIFQPLGMTSASMRQPLPQELQERMSKAYLTAGDSEPFWYEYAQWPAAGSAALTAPDMARFMIAHLQDGTYGRASILLPATARLMHKQAYSSAPGSAMNGMALGFYEDSRNGHRVLAHDGATIVFKAQMRLIPDAHVGLFVALNGPGRDGEASAIRTLAYQGFMDRYFPVVADVSPANLPASNGEHALAGNYYWSIHTESHYFRLASLFSQIAVRVLNDGAIEIDDIRGPGGDPLRWRKIAPFTWQEPGGNLLAAIFDKTGGLSYIASGTEPPAVLRRVPLSINSSWVVPAFVLALIVCLGGALLWPISALVRSRYSIRSNRPTWAALLVPVTSLLHIIFVGAWFTLLLSISVTAPLLNEHLDPWLRVLQLIGLIAAAGSCLIMYRSARALCSSGESWWIRVSLAGAGLSGLFLAWFYLTFRLLWPSLGASN